MNNTDWSGVTDCEDPALRITNFIKIIQDVIVLSTTTKKNNEKGNFVPRDSWVIRDFILKKWK